MRRAHRVLVTAATALAVMATPAAAGSVPDDDADRPGLQQRLDDVVAASGVGALVEVRDERGRWRGSSGTAELGTNRPVPVHGRFRVGSVTKAFLATVVLQLVDEDELRLDDAVERWLPGVVPDGCDVTVRQLLSHTSGLHDVVDTLPMPPSPAFFANRWRTWTATELIERAVSEPASFPPGTEYEYSSTGYLLLGQIVEKVTGQSYAQAVEARIIRPLRLRHTSLPGTSPLIRGPHPHGYVPTGPAGAPLLDYTWMNPSVFGAGGEMISTTSDLNRFFSALLSGRLLPAHLLEEMKQPGVEDATYGLGLDWWETTCGVRVYGHDGDAVAYNVWSFSTVDRQRQVTIALTPDFSADPDDAVDAFLDKTFCG